MNKKLGLTLIVVLGMLSIFAIVYYVFFFRTTDIGPVPEVESEISEITEIVDETQPPIEQIQQPVELEPRLVTRETDLPVGQANLERMAKSFAERFGSFSNQSNFSNIVDLKMFMTKKMQIWADAYVEKNKKDNIAREVYYGITTKSLSTEVKSYSDEAGEALVLVQTRRREAMGTTNNASKLKNQDILITFIKEDQAWKVDSAYWQD